MRLAHIYFASSIVFSASVLKMEYVKAEDSFFDSIEADANQLEKNEVKKDENNETLNLWAELGYRSHYGLEDKEDGLDFYNKYSGMALTRADLYLKADWKASDFVAVKVSARAYDTHFTPEQSFADLDETYIQIGSHQGLKYSVGRQYVVFGESDYFQVIDVVNPTDERELGLAELDETRLPVSLSRVSYVGYRWGSELVLLHEFRSNRHAESRSDFDPLITLDTNSLIFDPEPEEEFFSNNAAIRVFFSRPWGDVSVVAAKNYLHSRSVVDISFTDESAFHLGYAQYETIGAAVNYILGYWVLKTDFAYKNDLPVIRSTNSEEGGAPIPEVDHKSQNELMVGFRYGGISNVDINFELDSKQIVDFDNEINGNMITTTAVVDVAWRTHRDKLISSLLIAKGLGGDGSQIFRVKEEYDFNDFISLSVGYIKYSADINDDLYFASNNTRVFVGANVTF